MQKALNGNKTINFLQYWFQISSNIEIQLLLVCMRFNFKDDCDHGVINLPCGAGKARVCYNHLAGNKGIQLHDSLLANEYLLLNNGALTLSRNGQRFMQEFGIDLDILQASRSPLCRECLDWSERRSHLAGSLGRALLTQFENMNRVKSVSNSRIIRFSTKGERAFNIAFKSEK